MNAAVSSCRAFCSRVEKLDMPDAGVIVNFRVTANSFQSRFTSDFWQCGAHRRISTVPAVDVNGLPSLPVPMDHRQLLQPDASENLSLEEWLVQLDFSVLPGGMDPLLQSTYNRSMFPDAQQYAHLRWFSSSWWCANSGVAAIFPFIASDPREPQCRGVFGVDASGDAFY